LDLEQTNATVGGAALAIQHLAGHHAHLVVVVPGQLRAGADVRGREECHPGESQVMGVHKHVLHEEIRVARVLGEEERVTDS